jgi:EmrB/QacA subfamily drug resistance transporter
MNSRLLKGLSFASVILGFFMALLDTTIVNIALPEIARSFGTTQKDISWAINGYNLAFAIFIITASRIADQFGRKRIFLVGIGVFTAASLMCGSAGSLTSLVFFRVIQGMAAAVIVPVTVPLVLQLFSREKQGALMGAWGAIAGLAAASGPALGGFITSNLNWHWVFYVNLPFGIITIVLGMLLIQESFDPTASRKIDFGGIASLSVAMFSLTFALIRGNDLGWGSLTIVGLFVLSAAATCAFLLIEQRSSEPMLPLSLLRIGPFVGSAVTLLFLGAGMMSAIFMTAFYLTTVMGLSVLDAGLAVSVMPLASIATSAFAGPLSAKAGSRLFSGLGMALMALSVFLLGYLGPDSSTGDVVWRLLITGAGMGMTIAPVMGSAMRNTPPDKSGVVSGVLNMSRALGTVLGVAVLVAILNSTMGSALIDVKANVGAMVQNDPALNPAIKAAVLGNMSKTGATQRREAQKADVVLAKIDEQEAFVLAKASTEQKAAIQEAFDVQKREVGKLWKTMQAEVRRGMAVAFDQAFRYGSLILVIGVFSALFSDTRGRGNGSIPVGAVVSADA